MKDSETLFMFLLEKAQVPGRAFGDDQNSV